MPNIKKYKTKKNILLTIIILFPILLILFYFVFSSSKELSNTAVKYFSRPIRDAVGKFCSNFSISIMEVIYTLLGLFLILFVVRTFILLIIKRKDKLKTLFKRIGILLIIALYILGGYLCLWGIDYKSDSFSDKEGFIVEGITVDELYETTKFFIDNTILLADTVERDETGHFIENMDEIFKDSVNVYNNIETRFKSLQAESQIPKKMFYSKIMSMTGFTGVYFPFTGESNINMENTAALIPFTIAHELAHQRGVYSEQECNFLGITSCITSDLTVYRYSGFLAGTIYLMNALNKASPDLWSELRSLFSGNMLVDWTENNEYWSEMNSKVTTISESAYNTYLKANGQTLGMESYGACVDMLVAYYIQGGLS